MLKEVCHMATSFPAIYFLYDSAIILREHLKQSICQGHCVYFTTLFVAIYYIMTSSLCLIRENLNGMFV